LISSVHEKLGKTAPQADMPNAVRVRRKSGGQDQLKRPNPEKKLQSSEKQQIEIQKERTSLHMARPHAHTQA
jgi:hypothetical protein